METIQMDMSTDDDVNAAVLKMHDLSMDPEIHELSRASLRLQKQFLPILMSWIDDEHGRGSDPALVIAALVDAASSMTMATIMAVGPNEPVPDPVRDALISDLTEHLTRRIARLNQEYRKPDDG